MVVGPIVGRTGAGTAGGALPSADSYSSITAPVPSNYNIIRTERLGCVGKCALLFRIFFIAINFSKILPILYFFKHAFSSSHVK